MMRFALSLLPPRRSPLAAAPPPLAPSGAGRAGPGAGASARGQTMTASFTQTDRRGRTLPAR